MKVIFRTSKQELSGVVTPDGISSLAEYLNDLIHLALAKDVPEDEVLARLHRKLSEYTIHATESDAG